MRGRLTWGKQCVSGMNASAVGSNACGQGAPLTGVGGPTDIGDVSIDG